jgi:hypothetical protein
MIIISWISTNRTRNQRTTQSIQGTSQSNFLKKVKTASSGQKDPFLGRESTKFKTPTVLIVLGTTQVIQFYFFLNYLNN